MALSVGAEAEIGGSFSELGLCEELCKACDKMGWAGPTGIQRKSIPVSLKGRDVIGVAQTGSGKTAAYSLPMLQRLLETKQFLMGLVLCPTRELAEQVAEHIAKLGQTIGVRVCCLTGGVDMPQQAIELQKKPHIVVGTPGRLQDHFKNTRGFGMPKLRFLVIDEADRMLKAEFEDALLPIISTLPTDRTTFLFSATMTSDVEKLQRASLRDPVRIEVVSQQKTVSTLQQQFVLVPHIRKSAALVSILGTLQSKFPTGSIVVFCDACHLVQRLCLVLRIMGHHALPLSGKMTQPKRQLAIERFKEGKTRIMVATDVASRGLDIPHVNVVVNYSLPLSTKDYIHRVGRTARAGREGMAINIVTQYDVQHYKKIEKVVQVETKEWPEYNDDEAKSIQSRVADAEKEAVGKVKELEKRQEAKKGGKSADPQKRTGMRRVREENEKKFDTSVKKRRRV